MMNTIPESEAKARFPRISIVTPSYNQGAYIRETLQSLLDQKYPNLEVIIQDGCSSDGAAQIAAEFVAAHPDIFQLYVEKDAGQADALNRGFARVTGEILGFLNSDDTLYPGCLHSVAREVDIAKGRFIVMGRCVFTGEGSVYVGQEHPAQYISHFEHLAIWKRGYNTIPQPSVFWHKSVMERCGGFNPKEQHVLDYDLFCRFSERYVFHRVDELWSTYRMHAVSKSSQRTESEILDMSVAVSRRYWRSWLHPLRWRCEYSYRSHNRQYFEHARHHARRCEEAAKAGRYPRVVIEFLKVAYFSPKTARQRLLGAWMTALGAGALAKLFSSQTKFCGRHGDCWIGPVFRQGYNVPRDGVKLVCVLQHNPNEHHKSITCKLLINGRKAAVHRAESAGQFALVANVVKLQGEALKLEIRTDRHFVPRIINGAPDDRQLSAQLLDVTFVNHE